MCVDELLSNVMQCVVLSTARIERHFIISQEPELTDRLVAALVAVARGAGDEHVTDCKGAGTDGIMHGEAELLRMPFELRMLETALEEASRLLGVEVSGVVESAKDRMQHLRDPNVRTPSCLCTLQHGTIWRVPMQPALP
jgi:hypothetical protein